MRRAIRGPDATPTQIGPAAAMIVGLVGVDLGWPAPPAAAGHADRGDVVQHGLEHGRVVGVGRTQHDRDRQPAALTSQVQLGPLLAPIDRVCAGQVPPLTARRLKESTLTRSRSMRPAAPSSSSNTACSESNTPARAHSSRRRQQVVAEPQPSSLAGNRPHGVEVRAMKMSAATQFRAGTRRGTPPRGRGGGAGSNGWMRCHSSSGSSRSTRLVMAGSIPAAAGIAQATLQAVPECPQAI